MVSLWWDYPFPTRSTTVAYCNQPVSVIWVYHSFRWHQLNWYSYLLSLRGSLRDCGPTSSFTINTKGLAVRLMPSLVRWPEGLDTFQYQRPKTFACIWEYHSHWYVAICRRMKDVLREKVHSFWERNASHLSVNPPVDGQSGLRWVLTRGNPSDWYPALQHPAGCLKPSPVPFPINVSISTPILYEIRVVFSPQHLPSGSSP